jgi:hypothetical protein
MFSESLQKHPSAKGANLLDAKLLGWHEKIDVATLDMSGAKHCILGQLYGSSEAGCAALGQDNHRSFRTLYGFEASSIGGYTQNCDALKAEWMKHIALRQWQSPHKM